MTPLERRISGMSLHLPYGMERMLSLLHFVETTSIPTAAVPIHAEPSLLINPIFVEENCPTDEHLFMLILHELHHVLLGHTRLYKRVTPAHNIAFDAIINAILCRQLPAPCFTALFRESYESNAFPYCLLRPPEGFPNEPEFPVDMPEDIQHIIHELYYANTGTFHDIFELIISNISGPLVGLTGRLLGTHDNDTRGLEVGDNAFIVDIVREIVERWPMPKVPIVGRSMRDVLKDLTLQLPPKCPPHTMIKNILLRVAPKGVGTQGRHSIHTTQQIQQVWPSRDRQAFAVQASGAISLLYRKPILNNKKPSMRPVTIYIDVSGSMYAYRAALIRAILSCQRWIAPKIYLFSTVVNPTTLQELENGFIKSTGGTDGSAVLEHISENSIEHSIIFTDGYVGKQKPVKLLPRQRPHIVLTPDGHAMDFKDVAASTTYLPEI